MKTVCNLRWVLRQSPQCLTLLFLLQIHIYSSLALTFYGFTFMSRSKQSRKYLIGRSYKNDEFDWAFDLVIVAWKNNLFMRRALLFLASLLWSCQHETSSNHITSIDVKGMVWSQTSMGGFSGEWGGLNPPKFFLTPFRKCLTPLECCFTPLAHFSLPFHAPPEAIAYDVHPTENFSTPPPLQTRQTMS